MTFCKNCRKIIQKRAFIVYDKKTFDWIHTKDDNMFCGDGEHWAEPRKVKA